MQFFYDGIDPVVVAMWLKRGVITGVTTNPTLLRTAGLHAHAPEVLAVLTTMAPAPVSLQVETSEPEEIVDQALRLAAIASNVVVKVPIVTPSGVSCLDAIHHLSVEGVTVNATACLSPTQAILAGTAGAAYVSLLCGRIGDEGGDYVASVGIVRAWIDAADAPTRIIAASIRSVTDVLALVPARPYAVTVPEQILTKMADHRFSRQTVADLVGAAELINS